ncbi:hypothetical protein [Aeromicrobium wangtongii]|uniref:Uncharacterized protein n=1 Tax=Aeromicrobium wangtongii TaxID=2969247 RepID=A0ABY5M8V4_9ACTN|nr:hypothetical protein [Aeromicrobium wangtongii]MCD9199935.1 hypothetical protein [Aeromicrobium wangtongii]UUP13551.1 hypothetical protein NQV15_17135 [Aeromicrobium wangtongii]
MRVLRGLLIAIGLGCIGWGGWLMRDFTREQLTSEAFWLAGGVVLHDAVLAPLAVLIGALGARLLPRGFRRSAATAFCVWGTLTIAFLPVLSGEGGKAGNDTILGRPYLLSWIVMTLLLAAYAVGAGLRRRKVTARAS